MENNTEKQILEELKSINQSLKSLKAEATEVKQPPLIVDILKSLFIGVCVVAPAIAILYGLFQILGSWI
ncbi:hypothetical protein [Bacillus sp. Marseille-Q3570]|uniref:hypothetical protein n=1 Tax=Bacillus sp. Marseille-Q3570 TaxID=2963522 RepID=UPI0021B71BF9|nr:hypothetical protein [Bacillus sp. Marseille-Q3570]